MPRCNYYAPDTVGLIQPAGVTVLAIDAALLNDLRQHFEPGEIQELATHAAFFTGFGRMGAVFDWREELPVGTRKADGTKLTPWGISPLIV